MTRTRPGTVCIKEGCRKEQSARERCGTHYYEWWIADQHGDRVAKTYRKTKTIEERFRDLVDQRGPDECWPWKGNHHKKYGHASFWVSRSRKTVPAHSYALELATGEPCPPGKEACHTCDNPPCCNPTHIYYGTRQQNVDDREARGRAARGSQRTQAKLTEADVLQIRERYVAGETQVQLAAEFGIADPTVSNIINGKTWTHVGGPTGSGIHRRGQKLGANDRAHAVAIAYQTGILGGDR